MARKARAPHEQQKIIWHGPSDLTFYGNRAEGHHAAMIEAQLVDDGFMTEKELAKRRSNPEPPPDNREPPVEDKPQKRSRPPRPQQKRGTAKSKQKPVRRTKKGTRG